jgi:hypothetical protein
MVIVGPFLWEFFGGGHLFRFLSQHQTMWRQVIGTQLITFSFSSANLVSKKLFFYGIFLFVFIGLTR